MRSDTLCFIMGQVCVEDCPSGGDYVCTYEWDKKVDKKAIQVLPSFRFSQVLQYITHAQILHTMGTIGMLHEGRTRVSGGLPAQQS